MQSKKISISVASQNGVSWLVSQAEHARVYLTSHERLAAIMDSPERLDDAVAEIHRVSKLLHDRYLDNSLDAQSMQDFDELLREFGMRPDFRLASEDPSPYGGF